MHQSYFRARYKSFLIRNDGQLTEVENFEAESFLGEFDE